MDPNHPSKELTPEERLFKIIQEGEKSGEKDDTLISSADKPELEHLEAENMAPFSEGLGLDQGVNLKKARRAMDLGLFPAQPFSAGNFQSFLTVRNANRVLFAGLAVFSFYFVMNQFFLQIAPGGLFKKHTGVVTMPPFDPPANPLSLDNLQSYLETMAKRNIFQPWKPPAPVPVAPAAPAGPASAAAPAPGANIQSVLSKLKLSGIYLGDTPEALIEDTEEKRTYTVYAGSQIKGLTVKEVHTESVVLSDGQSETVLR